MHLICMLLATKMHVPPGHAMSYQTRSANANALSGCAKLFVSLRATAKHSPEGCGSSQILTIASFHFVPLAMTNTQLILPKYLHTIF